MVTADIVVSVFGSVAVDSWPSGPDVVASTADVQRDREFAKYDNKSDRPTSVNVRRTTISVSNAS